MISAKAYAALSAKKPLQPFQLERRDPRPDDIVIEIAYCGICHSDIHTARGEWGPTAYPCVPGHEIVGTVVAAGKKVRRFKPGDLAGVGCFVDSCGKCQPCRASEEQFCQKHISFTYNSTELDGVTPTRCPLAILCRLSGEYVVMPAHKSGATRAKGTPFLIRKAYFSLTTMWVE